LETLLFFRSAAKIGLLSLLC